MPEDLIKVEALCDCDDAVKSVNSDKQSKKKDRVSWDIARIREMKEKGEIFSVKWHEGTGNIADVFTKTQATRAMFFTCRDYMLNASNGPGFAVTLQGQAARLWSKLVATVGKA
mgnify:CR=1 FL=1